MKAIQEEEQILIFKVGHVMCCVAARDVDSVINAQEVNYVPHQASSIAGVIQYRDETVSIINVFKKFDLATPDDPKQGRFIMAYTHHGIVGYWVDDVIDITTDLGAHWSAPPIFVDGNVFDKTLIWNEKLVLSTDFDKLFAMHDSTPLQEWANEQGLVDVSAGEYSEPEENAKDSHPVANHADVDTTPLTVEDAEFNIESGAAESLTELEKIDNISEVDEPGEMDSILDTDASQSTVIHIADSISIPVIRNQKSRKNSTEEKTRDNKSNVEKSSIKNAKNEVKQKKVHSKKVAKAEKSVQQNTQEKVLSFEYTQSRNSQPVYEAIKLYLEPTSKQLKWVNDPYMKQRPERAETPNVQDVEKFFEEKLAGKIQEYFSSVDASKSANEHFEKASDLETDLESEIETDIEADEFSIPSIESDSSAYSNFGKEVKLDEAIDNESEFNVGDLSLPTQEIDDVDESMHVTPTRPRVDKELRAKREASVLKVIDRIQKNKPNVSPTGKLRALASILFMASIVFLLAHFDLLPGFIKGDVVELQLINEVGRSTEEVDINLPVLEEHTSIVPEISTTREENTALGAIALKKEKTSVPISSPVINWQKYVVLRGDTLWHIADRKLNDPFRYPDLARWSHIKNPDLIYPGDEVKYTRDNEK